MMGSGEKQKKLVQYNQKQKFEKVDKNAFPHNEGDRKVRHILNSDFKNARTISLVTGYASLDEIIHLIHRTKPEVDLKILFGNEPSIGNLSRTYNTRINLNNEMKKYWLEERQISLTHSFAILSAYEKLLNNEFEVFINSSPKPLHAKIYLTENACITGSSNYSKSGLGAQRELNTRIQRSEDDERYVSCKNFVDACFYDAADYREDLISIFEQLIRKTTWREALACACKDMLDGSDNSSFLKDLTLDNTNLWPHQKQAISQGLSILREQGSVLIADSTGSGKTKTGLWLMVAADSMIKRTQKMTSIYPDPVLAVPNGVEKEWRREFRREVSRVPEIITHGKISGNPQEGTEKFEILERLTDAPVLLVDEAHNFYNKSNRTTRMRAHGAQSSVLLTATPINRSFDDLISLMELLSQDDFDEELDIKLKNLSKKVYSKNKLERINARREAAECVQNFTIRRTRFDLDRIASKHPKLYLQKSRKKPGFPNRDVKGYDVKYSTKDKQSILLIEKICSQLKGIAYISDEIRLTERQIELGTTEETIVKQTLALAKAAANYRIWSSLSSSRAACLQHVTGQKKAIDYFDIKTLDHKTKSIPEKLSERKLPLWSLTEDYKLSENVPDWLVDKAKFRNEIYHEIERYKKIGEQVEKLSESMSISRINRIISAYKKGKKVLCFDWHLISLHILRTKLIKHGVNEERVKIFDPKNKLKAVEYFGLDSDDEPFIGLCSDSLNEGINLQGAGCLINLDRPTTVRRFEQRMGRIDRMNSRHDNVLIETPELPELIQDHITDHLTSRLELVRDVLGGNDRDRDDDIEMYDEAYTGEGSNAFEIEDAFSPIRKLIGEEGIISDNEYDNFGVNEVRAKAEVSILQSESPWCFFAIRGSEVSTAKWVLLTYTRDKPKLETNLTEICKFLMENLDENTTEFEDKERAAKIVGKYFEALEDERYDLLPKRYKTALNLGKQHFAKRKSMESRRGNNLSERYVELLNQFQLNKDSHHSLESKYHHPKDKFLLAEAWINLTKDIQRDSRRRRDGRSTTKTRKEKYLKALNDNMISLETIEEMISNVSDEKSISEDVSILIAAIPLNKA